MSHIKIPAEREAQVLEAVNEMKIVSSGVIKKEILERTIRKIKS